LCIAAKDESLTGEDIIISEDDIENLKRSKGAVYSAIMSLLNKVEKDIKDVKKIYIAGGFGSYLNIEIPYSSDFCRIRTGQYMNLSEIHRLPAPGWHCCPGVY